MKNVTSTLKKWRQKLRNSKLEKEWNQWISIKQHDLMDFAKLINSKAPDFFKMRALLFLIVPGYWRRGYDSDKAYVPEFKKEFSINFSKQSKEVIDFTVQILTTTYSGIHQYFMDTLPEPGAVSIKIHDKNNVALNQWTDNPIRSLGDIDAKYYGEDDHYFGKSLLQIGNAIIADLLSCVDEKTGDKLFENLFFARKPVILLRELQNPIYIDKTSIAIELFIERVTNVVWIKKLCRFLFAQSLEEKDPGSSNHIMYLYVVDIVGSVSKFKISEKQKADFFAEEVSFILENTSQESWQGNPAFEFGFRSPIPGGEYDPISDNLNLLVGNKQSLLDKLLKRIILSPMTIGKDNIETAQVIVKKTKDSAVEKFFLELISKYHLSIENGKKEKQQNSIKEEKNKILKKEVNSKSEKFLKKMMGC